MVRSSIRRGIGIALKVGLVVSLACGSALAATQSIAFSVSAGKHDRANTPINFELSVAPDLKDVQVVMLHDNSGNAIVGQLTPPGLLAKPLSASSDRVVRELHFILPDLKADQTKNFTADISTAPIEPNPSMSFHWQDTPGDHDDLLFGTRPVLRYMYHQLDESSADSRMDTFKVYHHVFDPATGGQLLTKGPGGLWPHHHGVFYGFNKATYDGGKPVDIWHCPEAYQEHSKFLAEAAGPVLGRQLIEVNWFAEPKRNSKAKGDEPNRLFAKEQRELTIYNIPGGTMLDFASRLNALLPPVHLDGDPQHAGFHFRASEEVHSKFVKQTYFLRTDGKGPLTENAGKGDETRNWDDKAKDPRTVNLPWDAMSFVVGDKRYTVAYLDRTHNPKEARFSERDYGRIGSYFVTDVTPDKPLDVNYRLWIQDGEMTVPQCAALDANFDDPPTVTLK